MPCSSNGPLKTSIFDEKVAGVKEDLLESVKIIPSSTYSLVKIAIIHMEGDPKQAFDCFKKPDIYYHRGQGLHSSFSSSESAH